MKNWKTKLSDFLFLLPGSLIYLIFMVVPIVVCFYYSFTNWDGISPTYKFIGMKNFVNLMTDQAFWDSVKTTLILTAFNVIFVNVFGVLIAVWMDKKEKTYNLCKAVIFIPCVLSSVVVSFIWSYMTQGNGGVINEIIGFFGGGNVDFFASPFVTTLTVTMAISWAGLGFYVTVYDASLKTIPQDLYEAAQVDGASAFHKFFRITLPLLVPGLTISVIFSVINALRQYDFVKIMTPQTIETIAVNAVSRLTDYNMLGYSSAIVLVLFLFIGVVTAVQYLILKKMEVDY